MFNRERMRAGRRLPTHTPFAPLQRKMQMESVVFKAPGPCSALGTPAEKLLNLHEAAKAIGAHYWQLQRAVRRGDIPSYTPFNSRKLVKLSEVVAYVDATRQGGLE
jgi:hypothetical protein